MHPIVNIAVTAARNASKIILRSVDRLDKITIDQKAQNDFVTEVDKAAEQEIISTIQKVYPNHAIIAEESGQAGESDFVWIIDPLDGTNNFIHGIPHFAISIAFRNKNRVEHGVIYDPIRQELFTASRGEGAKLNNYRLRVSENKLPDAIVSTGFPTQHQRYLQEYMQILQSIYPEVSDVRCSGSAALDLAYIAAGRLDGYWELGLKLWDMAAGALMVKEAGGLVSDKTGMDDYLSTGEIIAGNPKVFKNLLKVIQPLFVKR